MLASPPKRWHRWLGIVLLVPLCVWIATGVVFLLRPGYAAAYADLAVARKPLAPIAAMTPQDDWRAVKHVQTVLGRHLLVRSPEGDWRQLDPVDRSPRPMPGPDAVRRLVADAIEDRARYGRVASVRGDVVTTTTDVRITLDWPALTLDQRGPDTRWIAWAYDIHRLEWTGVAWVDKALGIGALAVLAVSSALGGWLAFAPRR